ncbi:capsid protein [Halorubrum sodomense tailed virus 2]|uniref:Capsid protein n=1 Tax=Halorubrum sodomense tailed virus 2 TaxID=1262527 RepID=L7TN45_9CAUD|nr:major head protein [Halorubrum sodomense tailed virus 2]AGC34282.1 capsid protein [Halorubrum sodomense tailed virus 2]
MPVQNRHEVKTKDGVDLDELLEKSRTLIDIYNDQERPFRDMFAEMVDQQTFYSEPQNADVYWEELAEGEHPRTVGREPEDNQIFIRDKKFGRSVGMTQDFIEKHTEERVLRKIRNMLEGADNTMRELIISALETGYAQGQELWYEVPDYGEYQFSQTHSHKFDTTDSLFDNDGTDDTAYPAHRHIEKAKQELTHHGFEGPFVALVSSEFKYALRDEIAWDAQYHIPMATGMRSADIFDLDIVIDGVRLVESPWMTGMKMWVTQANNGSPVKVYEDSPVHLRQGSEGGGPVLSPGDFVGANAYARWGVKNVDPLRAVYVNATQVE